ncbi:MAG: adenylate cyclase [Geobacteraceae bacterium GWC2_58_44]|nr:MAG: adenylate cyclase [Geobacteraceae bacterium GWC2_58_44]HBG05496.1 adenylate cyclase [Geobacter sp.]
MGKEIERKFLVNGNQWRVGSKAAHTCQGYLVMAGECTVRVRLQEEQAFLTIKGKPEGITRLEYEYRIPAADARELLARLCLQPYIEKNRYDVMHAGVKWEVDEFLKENEGLVVAEVELESEEQLIDLPPWVGEEVSGDPRYSNANLVKNPYSRWPPSPP